MGILENGQTVFFLVSFLMKLGFFCKLFPKSLQFLDKLGDNICPFKILIAVSSLQLPCTRGNFNFCEIIFPFSNFSRFIIFLIVNHSFFSFIIFYHFFCVKRKITSVMTDFWNKFTFLTISWMRVIDIQCFNLTVKKI